jgi:hypothetical protein
LPCPIRRNQYPAFQNANVLEEKLHSRKTPMVIQT